MDKDKKAIIIKEIHYWRKSKLLPEHYCDFLLNLYGGGAEAASARAPAAAIRDSKGKVWLLGLGLISIISIVALNFNVFPLPLQIISGSIAVILLLAVGRLLINRSLTIAYLCIGAGCFLMLIAGEWLLMQHQPNNAAWAIGYLIACCIVWMIIGGALRLGFLLFCGLAGILIVFGWMMSGLLSPMYGIPLQVFWAALTLSLIGGAWLVRVSNRSMTRVLGIVGLIAWIGPEAQALLLEADAGYWPQAVLVAKIIAAGTVLYMTRKKWIEWVA